MKMLSIILNLMGKTVLLIALGYYLRRKEIISERFQKDIKDFLLNVVLPASILLSGNSPTDHRYLTNIKITAIIGCIYYLGIWLVIGLLSKVFFLSDKKQRMFSVLTVFANNTIVGIPLVREIVGMIHIWNVLFYLVAIRMISGPNDLQLKKILKTPTTVPSLLAVIIYLSPIRYPLFFQETLSLLNDLLLPISMLVVGSSLAQTAVLEKMKDPWTYVASLLRLVLIPLIVLMPLYLVPGISNVVTLTCCVIFCLPCSMQCVIYAQKYDCEPEFASCTMIQSAIFMIVTIPLYLIFANKILAIG